MRPLQPIAAFLFVLVGAVLSAFQQAPPPTTFRSGVELFVLDVTVLDKDGKPIPDLQVRDFTLEVGGRRRPVVAAQFVQAGRQDGVSAATPAVFASAVSSLAAEARTIYVVVDIENIRSGEGRGALDNLSDYFDTLPPTDHIGFIVLPSGSPSLEPTTDRAAVRALMSRTVGASSQIRACEPTIGEAAAVAAEDSRGMEGYAQRLRGIGCGAASRPRAEAGIQMYRQHTITL